jgi:hypothetical protein
MTTKPEIRKLMRKWGKKGGIKSAKKLCDGKTPEELSAIMRARANVRWHPAPAPENDLEAAS